MASLDMAIVGLGQRSWMRAIQAFHGHGDLWRLVAVCDTKDAARERFALSYPDVPIFEDVLHLIQWHQQATDNHVDCAYVAVLHYHYFEVVVPLLEASIHVLKEKPAASAPAELNRFQSLGSSKFSQSRGCKPAPLWNSSCQNEGMGPIRRDYTHCGGNTENISHRSGRGLESQNHPRWWWSYGEHRMAHA